MGEEKATVFPETFTATDCFYNGHQSDSDDIQMERGGISRAVKDCHAPHNKRLNRHAGSAHYGIHLKENSRDSSDTELDEDVFDLVNEASSDGQDLGSALCNQEGGDHLLDLKSSDTEITSSSYDSGSRIHGDDYSFRKSAEAIRYLPDQSVRCLHDELFSALISTHQETRGFFAKDDLATILTEDRVRLELASHFEDSLNEDEIAKYAKTICGETVTGDGRTDYDSHTKTKSFIKILAVLIIIQKTKAILKLIREDVSDSDLPLIKVPRTNDAKLFDLRANNRPDTVLTCFQRKWKWDQLNIRNFEEWQWTTLPLEFAQSAQHRDVPHYSLQEKRILPFTDDSRQPQLSGRLELEGGFASVFKVAIHPKHHNFHKTPVKSSPACFAVKSLHSQNKIAFTREVEMLKKFSGDRHQHLISLLATYEQSGRFFLLFDWAEADLHTYWRRINPNPSFNRTTLLWVANQCKGIASGITKIHAYESTYAKPAPTIAGHQNVVFGHHGDIKPENVLWFAGTSKGRSSIEGTLKLSDFGLAEFSIHQTLTMTPKSKWAGSLAYRAPETDLEQDATIGRSYDIWTLGCLYLEFITWVLGGAKLLDEFVQARKARDVMWHGIETHTFFMLKIDNETGKTAIIKSPVVQFIEKLRSHPNCSNFLRDFLDLVEQGLLVVKTDNKQQLDRISINQVYQRLSGMLKRCESDPGYAIQPVAASPGLATHA